MLLLYFFQWVATVWFIITYWSQLLNILPQSDTRVAANALETMCLQIVSESLTSIVMVKIYCSEMFRTWIKIRCLFQDRFVKTFLFIIPSPSRPWITNISCFGETTTKFNIHTNIWIWHWASIQVKPIASSIENYLFKI